MKQPGFSLIEIIIAVAISSVLSLILYRAFSQTNRLVQQVRNLMDDTSDTLSSYAQLEKDFSAIFMPTLEEIKKASAPPAQAAVANQTTPKTPAGQESKEKKPEIIPFKTTMEGSKLATISFVTTNAFSILDEAASRPVRVTYKLKPQEGEGNKLFVLLREELPYDQKAEGEKKSSSAKPTHAYALIRNISSFSAKFSAYDCKEESKELVSLSEWGTDEQKKKCPQRAIPEFVEISLDVTDVVTGRVTAYTCAITIPAASCPEEKEVQTTAVPQQPQQVAQQAPTASQASQVPRVPQNPKLSNLLSTLR